MRNQVVEVCFFFRRYQEIHDIQMKISNSEKENRVLLINLVKLRLCVEVFLYVFGSLHLRNLLHKGSAVLHGKISLHIAKVLILTLSNSILRAPVGFCETPQSDSKTQTGRSKHFDPGSSIFPCGCFQK